MPKDPSPLLGYNNNIRHKARVFHVQTEDSGIRHPHIITHLFMDGGRILKSVKTSYAEHLGIDKMAEVVQNMMKAQHKAMLVALRDGQYDLLVEGGAASAAARATLPDPAEARATAVTEPRLPAETPKKRAPSVRPPPVLPAESPRAPAIMLAPDLEEGPPTARNSGPPEELTLDIDALERAAVESSSPLFLQSDLPPPPANMFRERAGGGYSTVTPPTASDKPRGSGRPPPLPPQAHGQRSPAPGRYGRSPTSRPPAAAARRGTTPRPPPPSAGKAGLARPPGRPRTVPPPSAGARPAAAFGTGKPPRGGSIFGEDLISDKSLDEVILSYLAEDLDPPADKKK
jgi:hypothetical protein